ncbi:hypothetical protein EBU94_05495, partial [bacterium]|nr:hypothetical protein [bacterium]
MGRISGESWGVRPNTNRPKYGGNSYNESNTINNGGEYNNEGRFPANIILECICDEVIKGEKGEITTTNRIRKGEAAGGLDINENRKAVQGIDNYGDKGDIHTNPNCPCYLLDEQSGFSKSSDYKCDGKDTNTKFGQIKSSKRETGYVDKGGASRFFYQAKVSKAERNMGLDSFEDKETNATNQNWRCIKCDKFQLSGNGDICNCVEPEWKSPINKNNHPTIKPVALMTYLCRL